MSCDAEVATTLRQNGHKLTPQRPMVVSALRHAEGHRTAAQVLEQVQCVYPFVDISTVYRTTAVLKELRLVTETDMGGGELAYEWATEERRHHLICRTCGAVQQVDHAALGRLAETLGADYGFRADLPAFRHIRALPGMLRTEPDFLTHPREPMRCWSIRL